MRKNELLAYAAGIVDGEGCIHIHRMKAKTKELRYNFGLLVTVSSVTPELIFFMHAIFGGSVDFEERGGKHRRSWRWSIIANHALKFLKEIQPFLLVKTRQCSLGIEFQARRPDKRRRNAVAAHLADEKSYWEMRRLNCPPKRLLSFQGKFG